MSLQTATLGWGVISKRNNIIFNIPYICNIEIGMDFADLNKLIRYNSKIGLQIREDSKNFHKVHYMDESDNIVFSVYIIGEAVHRIYYKGLVSMIPPSMIYTVGKKNFITNIRIDGYMLAIKDENEIWLKEVTSVQAIDTSSESLGVVKKSFTKSDAQRSSKAWSGVFNTKSIYTDEMYKQSQSEVNKLENEYKSLVADESKLRRTKDSLISKIDKRKMLDEARKKLSEASSIFDKAKAEYTKVVTSNMSNIRNLVRLGKLYQNNGIITLNENSNKTRVVEEQRKVPRYRTVSSSYEPEMLLHEDYDQYRRRARRERTTHTERVFDGYEIETYPKRIVDNDFIEAERIVKLLKPYLDDYSRALSNLEKAKQEYEKIEKQISEYMGTSEYKNGLKELDTINAELGKLQNRIAELKKKIYR